MRLFNATTGPGAGRFCPSDHGIIFVRLAKGWRVEVRRPLRRRVECYPAKNLAQATAWARQHWRPRFLESLIEGLPTDHAAHQLHRQATLGDPTALLALMDAAEERGMVVDRLDVIKSARKERLFQGNEPATAEERAEQVRTVGARADPLAIAYAELVYEMKHSGLFWAQKHRDLYPSYDNLSRLPDPALRQRCRQTIRDGLAALGLQAVAEASYPLDGPDAGHTVVIVYWASSGDFRDRGRKDLEKPIHEVLVSVLNREFDMGIKMEG